uniref:Uncharacterized protein n=1 Tax=Amphimedon queenslandica TaxID=400682 RepID=A0A1X7SK74_AMPQE
LPERSTIQACTGAFLHDTGANSSRRADQVAQYLLFCHNLEKDGVLIFDEVKVINQLMWNCWSQEMIGICMSHLD